MKSTSSIAFLVLLLTSNVYAEDTLSNLSIAGSFYSGTATMRVHNTEDTRIAIGMNLYGYSDDFDSQTRLGISGSYEIGLERTKDVFAYVYPRVGFATASAVSDDSYFEASVGLGAEYYLLTNKIALGIDFNAGYQFSDLATYAITTEGYLLYRF